MNGRGELARFGVILRLSWSRRLTHHGDAALRQVLFMGAGSQQCPRVASFVRTPSRQGLTLDCGTDNLAEAPEVVTYFEV